jgi:hypothetical protein
LQLHSVLNMPSTTTAAWKLANEAGLTIVTSLNTARLDMLAMQCGSWPGHLVAVLYVPLLPEGEGQQQPTQLTPAQEELLHSATAQATELIDRCVFTLVSKLRRMGQHSII